MKKITKTKEQFETEASDLEAKAKQETSGMNATWMLAGAEMLRTQSKLIYG